MARWGYSEGSRRYRNLDTGRWLSASSERAVRDDFMARRKAEVDDLSAKLASGDVTVRAWERAMQAHVKQTHGVLYAEGRGGRRRVPDAEWKSLATVVKAQYGYLRAFAEQAAAGELTAAQIATRSAMYLDAATASHARGVTASYGGLELEQHPGDGQTQCLSNCTCSLSIDEGDGEWRVTWRLGDGEPHCEDCPRMAGDWSPLVVPKPAEVAA